MPTSSLPVTHAIDLLLPLLSLSLVLSPLLLLSLLLLLPISPPTLNPRHPKAFKLGSQRATPGCKEENGCAQRRGAGILHGRRPCLLGCCQGTYTTRSYHDRVTESQSLETKNALPRGAELADTGHILRQRPYGRAVPFEASRWYPNCASACLVP